MWPFTERKPRASTGETRETFVPADGAVEVRFVAGNDGLAPIPLAVSAAGLNQRFAVIQETGVEGCVDWYFDELLWRTLVEFAATQGDDQKVLERTTEEPLNGFLERWDRTKIEDREPPWTILIRSEGQITFAMVTEYWDLAGGPQPYSDSYTYSLFSHEDVSEKVIAWLRTSDPRRWMLQPVIEVPESQTRSPPTIPRRPWRPVHLLLRLVGRG
jgi:hypothetical protein